MIKITNLNNILFNIKRLMALLIIIFALSACDDFKVPIDADDFGFPKVTVLASGEKVVGTQENELSNWTFSGYTYNGGLAVMMVYNPDSEYGYVWSSWDGNGEYILTQSLRNSATQYCCIGGSIDINGDCQKLKYCAIPTAKYETIENAPCIFSQGQGLYMLLTTPGNSSGITDPNLYSNVNRLPAVADFFTLGLWQYTGMYQNGQLANGYIGGYVNDGAISQSSKNYNYNNTTSDTSTYTDIIIPSNNINGKLYLKILDRYYDDNSGFYLVSLKNGFSPKTTPPIATVIALVTKELNDASEVLFNNIIIEGNYRLSLKAALSLYMIIHGILYIFGVLNMNQKELISLMMKLVIVIQLLTTSTSWSVFNSYFFTFFTQGIGEIIGIITYSISGTSDGTGLTFFDSMINLLFSYETTMKILSLIFSVPSGIVTVAMIYVAFGLFVLSLAKGLILYLLAYIAISLLISLAPIFICFLLFRTTRSLFDTWINQFASYFFQPLLVFTALAMMAQNIINSMYKLLGFKVCYNTWVKVLNTTILKMWQICPFNINTNIKTIIPIPGYGFWDVNHPLTFQVPYGFQDTRYIDLPFLKPAVGSNSYDQSLIEAFNNPGGGYNNDLNMPMLYNSFILLLTTYLMFIFYDMIPGLAKGIAGVASTGGGIGGVANKAAGELLGGIKSINSLVGAQLGKTKVGEAINKARSAVGNAVSSMTQDIPDKDKTHIAKMAGKVGDVGNGIFRRIIPHGSFRTKDDKDLEKIKYNAWKEKMMKRGGVLKNIFEGEQKFDASKKDFKEKIRDKIGSNFDFIANPLAEIKDNLNPYNRMNPKGMESSATRDKHSEDIAILRSMGKLDHYQKDNDGNSLSTREIRRREAQISREDVEAKVGELNEQEREKMEELRKKVAEIKKARR